MYRINRMEILRGLKAFAAYLRNHAGQIGYYACVALVLTAVGMAAERYRGGGEMEETLILPAVELATPAPREAEPALELPEGMKLLRGYAAQPEWNDALCHWETHMAADYGCAGASVRSVSDGRIITVGKSGMYGGFVEVETDEFLIRYASMNPSEELEPGESIGKGDVLGSANDSMPGEAHMGAHLHLELIRDGSHLDFAVECGKKINAVD